MPTLYLHFGMPKTGTKTIEQFFGRNKKIIQEQCSLYWPPIKSGSHPHKPLFFPAVSPDNWKSVKDGRPVAADDIVISCEIAFWRLYDVIEKNEFETIKGIFPGYTVKVILYLHRHDDFIKSMFSEFTKAYNFGYPLEKGEVLTKSYAQYFADSVKNLNSPLYISKLIEKLVLSLGRENVLLRLYDRKNFPEDSVVYDFFHVLGRSVPPNATHRNYNLSLPKTLLPYLSSDITPSGPDNSSLRSGIAKIGQKVFTFPQGSGVGKEYEKLFLKEIDKVDTYLPGFKDAFSERELDFSFPEVDVANRDAFFSIALQYLVLEKVHKQEATLLNLEGLIRANGEAARLRGREVFFWGAGAAWQYYRQCFTGVLPRGMLLDASYARACPDTGGLAVLTPETLAAEDKKLPVIVFSRAEHHDALMQRAKTVFDPKAGAEIIECILHPSDLFARRYGCFSES